MKKSKIARTTLIIAVVLVAVFFFLPVQKVHAFEESVCNENPDCPMCDVCWPYTVKYFSPFQLLTQDYKKVEEV